MTKPPDYDFEHDAIDRLARIEERLTAGILAATDHETRLRSLELRQYLLAGAAAFVGAVFHNISGMIPWR